MVRREEEVMEAMMMPARTMGVQALVEAMVLVREVMVAVVLVGMVTEDGMGG